MLSLGGCGADQAVIKGFAHVCAGLTYAEVPNIGNSALCDIGIMIKYFAKLSLAVIDTMIVSNIPWWCIRGRDVDVRRRLVIAP